MQDPFELDRVFLEGGDDAGFAAVRAGEDEMQGQQGLPDARTGRRSRWRRLASSRRRACASRAATPEDIRSGVCP